MATIYKVCTAAGSANASINLSNGTCPSTWSVSAQGDCDVYQKYKTLTFTASIPSTSSYTIYYTYTVTYYENYELIDTQLNVGNVTMPAGATSVTKSVLCDYYAWCTSSDVPTERGEYPAAV
jgi:hypothetical protein